MIVRVSEALVRVGLEDEFMVALRELVQTFPERFDGLIRHEILVDQTDARRVQYVSVWRDEAALIGYAGAGWRTDAVTFPDEEALLAKPLTLRHFTAE